MDDLILPILALFLLAVIALAIVLPIVALAITIRSRRKLNETTARLEAAYTATTGRPLQPTGQPTDIQQINARLQRIEVTLAAHSIFPVAEPKEPATTRETEPVQAPTTSTTSAQTPEPPVPPVVPESTPAGVIPPPAPRLSHTMSAGQIESVIGRRWVGYAAVLLILFATAFFLKYAFENRWIGELGRVAIGVAFGIAMCVLGFRYHRRRWRVFSQILTAGGIVVLYLSTYAAFGYYHLVGQKGAFIFLAILIAEAAALALIYEAPAIAIMALVGGFLTPLLLHSDRDQYRSFFTYIVALDVGALALLKHWRGLSSVAYFGTQLLFWIWYNERYHHQKRGAVLIFQTAVFLIFLLAHLGRKLFRRELTTVEDLVLILVNPFVFFATAYQLLNPSHHDWMGVFAIGMALVYASAAKIRLTRILHPGPGLPVTQLETSRSELLTMIGIALTFVTIAIPIQLRSNWITIAWAVEALIILWAGLEIRSLRLRASGLTLFGLALAKLLVWDTPFISRLTFIPIFNRYFLSSLVVIGCLLGASFLYQKTAEKNHPEAPVMRLVFLFMALVTFWFVMSVETHTFFAAQAAAEKVAEDADHLRWLGQMALSVLWAAYAAILAAVGFIRRSGSLRWAALILFALTIVKAMLVDIAQLEQLYRIIVFFVLGVLLLLVAWGYHKAFHSRESST